MLAPSPRACPCCGGELPPIAVVLGRGGQPRLASIVSAAARMYRVPPDLLVRSKTAEPLYVRHIAMFVAWRHFGHSLGGIGRGFSRDRTTVRHAVRKIEAALAEDPAIRRDVTLLESYLRSAS